VTQDDAGNWRLSGVFDFEQALRGSNEYEFVAIAVFLAEGHPHTLHRALTAYGYTESRLDHVLSRRLMAWTLLHRHSNLARFLRHLPNPPKRTFDALAERWFGANAASP